MHEREQRRSVPCRGSSRGQRVPHAVRGQTRGIGSRDPLEGADIDRSVVDALIVGCRACSDGDVKRRFGLRSRFR